MQSDPELPTARCHCFLRPAHAIRLTCTHVICLMKLRTRCLLFGCLQEFGLPAPVVVPAQMQPDPEFPTVSFPNPEEGEGTWQMAFDTGAQ
jgi:hypothetical protein